MGVPKFYRWISERYPCLSEVVKEYQIPEFDNLYLDMNGIIHVCSHPNDDDPHFRISEDKIFADICHYIDFLFKMIQPKKVFFMAVDGVAPRAKMNQQRGRRFRSAKSALLLEQKAKESGQVLPTEARFDSNCITPGTEFMCRLHEILKNFVSYKVSTDELWQNLRIYLSGHETPGEGEHKIMDFIRYEKSQEDYNPNTRHCLYGLDADLIMLGLCSHEPHFSLLREEVRFGRKENQKRIVTPEETTFHLLHLSLLREYLGHEFSPAKEHIDFEFDLENIIDDFVLMSFLVGNDFIPHLPQLHIHHNALPILFKTYIDILPSLGGYINQSGTLNLERFEMFFQKLAEFDYEKFGESSNFPVPGTKLKENFEQNGICKDKSLEKLLDLGFSELSLSKINEYDSSSDDDDNAASFELEFSQHKMDYYRNKLEYDSITPEELQEQAEGYVRAIQWNLHYYYDGIASWSWYYPHHYAPYISDVKNFKNMKMNFEMGTPFTPFQQLLAVLPVQSRALLPKSYQKLMCDDDSVLKDCYPEDFKTDLNGKQQEWEAVVLIPFINESLLVKCAKMADESLTEEERSRNRHGPHLLYTHTDDSYGSKPSFLPGHFPPLKEDHSRCQKLDINVFRIPREHLRKGLCPGVLQDVYFPGFPTLKHVQHTAKLSNEEVKVFQMVSQRDNMMLTVTEAVDSDLDKVANLVLGKNIHVGWPHFEEAFIESVSSIELTYVIKNGRRIKTPTNSDIWRCKAESVASHYYRRLGIFLGEINVLVHAKCLRGSKLVCTSEGEVVEHKQWSEWASDYALQVVKEDIVAHCPKVKEKKSYKDLYPIGSVAFVLGESYYGCMGTIVSNDLKKNKGCIFLSLQLKKEPDLRSVISNKNQLASQHYMPGYVLAQRLGINSHLVSRLTGSYFIQLNSKDSMAPNKVNVGLNLKFNKKNEEVAGFTKKTEDNHWLYSEQVLETLASYLKEFPEFVERLIVFATQDVPYLEDMYPQGNGKELVQKVTEWLKTQQCTTADRQICGLNSLDEGVISAVEETVSKFAGRDNVGIKLLRVKPEILYTPFHCKGCVIPDPSAAFHLFDRVINVRHNLTVPLGLCGTVIAIREADRLCDYIYEVLFDEEFFGSLKLHSTSGKCYRMPPSALINISHGERNGLKFHSPRKVFGDSGDRRYEMSPVKTTSREGNKKHEDTGISVQTQVFRKSGSHKSSNQPFYKTDTSSAKTYSGTQVGMPSLAASLSETDRQFIMPKATTPQANRGHQKSVSKIEGEEYRKFWTRILTKNGSDALPSGTSTAGSYSKVPSSKSSSLDELLKSAATNSQKPEFSGPPPESVPLPSDLQKLPEPVPSQAGSVSCLMNYCQMLYGRPPVYSYHNLGMRKMCFATVVLPNGESLSGEMCQSRGEAAENVAEHALAMIVHRLGSSYFPGPNTQAGYCMGGTNSYDLYYNSTAYQPPTHNVGTRFPTPVPSAAMTPYSPAPIRQPAIASPIFPQSFVKQNEMFLAGQIPPEQLFMNAGASYVDYYDYSYQLPKKIERTPSQKARTSASTQNMFVPLQALRHSTKQQVEDRSPVLDSEWPELPPPAAAAALNVEKQAILESLSTSTFSKGQFQTSCTDQGFSKQDATGSSGLLTCKTAAQVVLEQKPVKKTRLAAALPDIS